MFSGIVRGTGVLREFRAASNGAKAWVDLGAIASELEVGSSLSIDGACLTLKEKSGSIGEFDVSPETLSRTKFRFYRTGEVVNLEPALRASDALGGHIVLGHVDEAIRIKSIRSTGDSYVFGFEVSEAGRPYVVEKGSVAVDGISLTVAKVEGGVFEVVIVPFTYENTNLQVRKVGDLVNIEYDVLARYVWHMLRLKVDWEKRKSSLEGLLGGLY